MDLSSDRLLMNDDDDLFYSSAESLTYFPTQYVFCTQMTGDFVHPRFWQFTRRLDMV